ncbi:MAG: hypothetical protein ACI4PC_03335 [Oscillospiraceae bacterium]
MKKSLSLLLVIALIISLFSCLALTASAEEAALEVYTQTGDAEPVLAKSYTAEELAALAETAEEGIGYVYYKSGAQAVVATEYVTLDALLADAGVTFAQGDKLSFTCTDGPYTKGDFSYETLSARGYDLEGNAVPNAFAISWDQGALADGTVADIAAGAYNSGSVRFVCGATAEEIETESAAGNRMPSGVISVTVVSPEAAALEVYTQYADGEPVLAQSYTASQLAALAETAEEGIGYVYYKSGAQAVVATEYVTLDALLTDAGVAFAPGDSLSFTCTDGPYTKGNFSYEVMTSRGYDLDGNAVPNAFALVWDQGALADGTVADIAAGAYNSGSVRFVCGATAEEIETESAAGNRMPSGVVAVTVVSPKEICAPTTQRLIVNGEEKTAEIYNINDYNYFKLRDLAALLNKTGSQFSIDYDDETRQITVTTGEAYTLLGTELVVGEDHSASCTRSTQTLVVDGKTVVLSVYNIDGYNFLRLRDAGSVLGFDVDYEEETATMIVTSK